MILNVYDKNGKAVKKCEAKSVDLTVGTVITLMDLLELDEIDNTANLLKVIKNAWNEVCTILSDIFPEINDDEWSHVKVKELLPVVVEIVKMAVSDMLNVPTEKN